MFHNKSPLGLFLFDFFGIIVLMIKRIQILFILILMILGNFLSAKPSLADDFELIKSRDFGTIYFVDDKGVRHAFPNEMTYKSWYGNDFSKVITVSNEILQEYKLGANITIRPGTYLVKIRTAPEVYAIEQGGVLREIQDESVAVGIYGDSWSKRVIDVPDVFFKDYIIGEPIKHDYTIPESVLYFDKSTNDYFYKNAGILRRFESKEDVLANKFNLDFAKEASRSYFVRTRPIVGEDKSVFNPVAKPITDKRDCSNTDLKIGIIVVSSGQVTSGEIEKVQTIKKGIPSAYSWATQELSSVDVNYATTVLVDDGYLIEKRANGVTDVHNEVINTFYDNNPDDFDFLMVFTNFTIPSEHDTNEIARFIEVTNKLEGIGKGNSSRAQAYGSDGKLKGIIMMGNINKYNTSDQSGLNQVLNVVNHEILHNWASYIKFEDEDGSLSDDLLRQDDLAHWSIYAGFISPLGGSGWIDNGDGTFTSGLLNIPEGQLRQYSDLDLYLMGLLPRQFVDDISLVVPNNAGSVANTISGKLKKISIEKIVEANGKHQCSIF